jgi:hypothetical protein
MWCGPRGGATPCPCWFRIFIACSAVNILNFRQSLGARCRIASESSVPFECRSAALFKRRNPDTRNYLPLCGGVAKNGQQLFWQQNISLGGGAQKKDHTHATAKHVLWTERVRENLFFSKMLWRHAPKLTTELLVKRAWGTT